METGTDQILTEQQPNRAKVETSILVRPHNSAAGGILSGQDWKPPVTLPASSWYITVVSL